MMEPYKQAHVIAFSQLLVDSYHRWTGWELVSGRDIAYGLFFAPFAITAQDLQADPVIQYANQAALDAWDTDWQSFIGMPSRLSAAPDPLVQDARADALRQANEQGWAMNYSGKRVSQTGKRFEILNTVLWRVTDLQGRSYGQAARIGAWRYI